MEVGNGHEWERDRGATEAETPITTRVGATSSFRSQSFFGDNRSGAEQREQQSHRVIRFATGDEHDREQGQIGEPEWSKRSGRRAAQKPPEPRDPERREERADQQQLQRKQLGSVTGWILGADRAGELQLWPPVSCLPEEVGHPENEGQRGPPHNQGAACQVGAPSDEAAAGERGEQEHTRCLFSSPMPTARPTSSIADRPPRECARRGTRRSPTREDRTSSSTEGGRAPSQYPRLRSRGRPAPGPRDRRRALERSGPPAPRRGRSRSQTTSAVRGDSRRTSTPTAVRVAASARVGRRTPSRGACRRHGSTAHRGDSRSGWRLRREARARLPQREERAPTPREAGNEPRRPERRRARRHPKGRYFSPTCRRVRPASSSLRRRGEVRLSGDVGRPAAGARAAAAPGRREPRRALRLARRPRCGAPPPPSTRSCARCSPPRAPR